MKARIVIGANYGDEGKGTVVAHYTKASDNVLNILTNGGSQRGHSILTEDGSITFQHFGSGTYHGADNYYSRYFILNPMQFKAEYDALLVKPKNVYRDRICRWSTPYDCMANLITEEQLGSKASCGMGIWLTIQRCNKMPITLFDDFMKMEHPMYYLEIVKRYYERFVTIPSKWKDVWDSPYVKEHFLNDCEFMASHTQVAELSNLAYDNLIFENGQGLLLSDTGKDTYDTTPSDTGINYALKLIEPLGIDDVTAHYVTRPYLTRHGDGILANENHRSFISSDVKEDRTNHFNEHQGKFRYGFLDVEQLHERILSNAKDIRFELEVTHCDEMDRMKEFSKYFGDINAYDSALIR